MKTSEEMTESALNRIQKERTKRKKQLGMLSLAACFAVMLAGTAIFWRQPMIAEDEIRADEDLSLEAAEAESAPAEITADCKAESKDRIVIHQLDAGEDAEDKNVIRDTAFHYICLYADDFVRMEAEQLNEYYGINIFPEVPADLSPEASETGIYRRNQGTGEIYHDSNTLIYQNEDANRRVTLTVSKGKLPFSQFPKEEKSLEYSVISGEKVLLGEQSDGTFYAEMIYCGAGFSFSMNGLTQEESIAVIRSVIK